MVNTRKCRACGAADFATHGVGIVANPVPLQGSVCLSCGHVALFVGEGDLERLRAWQAEESADG